MHTTSIYTYVWPPACIAYQVSEYHIRECYAVTVTEARGDPLLLMAGVVTDNLVYTQNKILVSFPSLSLTNYDFFRSINNKSLSCFPTKKRFIFTQIQYTCHYPLTTIAANMADFSFWNYKHTEARHGNNIQKTLATNSKWFWRQGKHTIVEIFRNSLQYFDLNATE